jgi:hypothetical protein
MASTYSDLKIELIGTGEQVGTWGSTTNVNLGTAIEEAITGSADVTFSSSDVTLTLTNTNGTQAARNLRLVCTGTSGGARNLILGSGCQIEKLYLIQNDLADTVTVKNTTGTGVAVSTGVKKFVFNDGTNVIDATSIIDLNAGVTGTLPVTNGGTGQTSYTNGQLLIGNTTGNTLTKATLTGTANRLTVTNGTGSITLDVDATNANTANKVVARDGSGNFSAGTITANLTGNVTGNVTGNATTSSSTTGNAATATALQTARTIGGVSFNGTANINLPGVNQTGTQNTSGNAATATKLTTASGSAPSYSARSWVNFDGTGSISIRASGNVASLTDIGVGDYQVNFSTAMPSANYGISVAGREGAPNGTVSKISFTAAPTTSAVRISYNGADGPPYDPDICCCITIA